MLSRRRATSSGKAHRFGGDWTSIKLDVLAKYLRAYTTALKAQSFHKIYIDAFAGTGYRVPPRPDEGELYLPELGVEGAQLLDGSAAIALKTEPAFDRCIFIERDPGRCAQLNLLRDEFPGRAIDVRQGDANAEVIRLCGDPWRSQRAVLFLDPYGMNAHESSRSARLVNTWYVCQGAWFITSKTLLTKSSGTPI